MKFKNPVGLDTFSTVSKPARLALASSLLLIVLVLLLTWTRFADNEAWRRLDEVKIRAAIEAALVNLVLAVPADPRQTASQSGGSTQSGQALTFIHDTEAGKLEAAGASSAQAQIPLRP